METDNGYIVEHRRKSMPTRNVAYICNNFKELRDYVEEYFDGGVESPQCDICGDHHGEIPRECETGDGF
jgi:hypothetical protein